MTYITVDDVREITQEFVVSMGEESQLINNVDVFVQRTDGVLETLAVRVQQKVGE